jgi:tetratricopeptide (TPR) repeat protein
VTAYEKHRRALLKAVAIGFIVHLGTTLMYFFTAHSIGVEVGLGEILYVGPLMIAATVVPISVAGIGVRELAAFDGAGAPARRALRAQLLLESGRLEEAEGLVAVVDDLPSSNPALAGAQLRVLRALGEAEALDGVIAALRSDGGTAEWLLVEALSARARHAEAIEASLRIADDESTAPEHRAWALLRAAELTVTDPARAADATDDEAIERAASLADRASTLDPSSIEAAYRTALLTRDDLDGGREHVFLRAVQTLASIDPLSPERVIIRASDALRRGQVDLARTLIRPVALTRPFMEQAALLHAETLGPDDAMAWLRGTLGEWPGLAHVRVAFVDRAVRDDRIRLALDTLADAAAERPGDLALQRRLARLYEESLGESDTAESIELRRLEFLPPSRARDAQRLVILATRGDIEPVRASLPELLPPAPQRPALADAWARRLMGAVVSRVMRGDTGEPWLEVTDQLHGAYTGFDPETERTIGVAFARHDSDAERAGRLVERAARRTGDPLGLRYQAANAAANAVGVVPFQPTPPEGAAENMAIAQLFSNQLRRHREQLEQNLTRSRIAVRLAADALATPGDDSVRAGAALLMWQTASQAAAPDDAIDAQLDRVARDLLEPSPPVNDKDTVRGVAWLLKQAQDSLRPTGNPGEPTSPTAYAAYAISGELSNLGQHELADAVALAGFEAEGDAPMPNNNFGYRLLEQDRRHALAIERIEKAYEVMPDNENIIDSLGWARYTQGRYEEALPLLERALAKLEPMNERDTRFSMPVVLDHIAQTHFRLGDTEAALEYWARSKTTARMAIDAIRREFPAYAVGRRLLESFGTLVETIEFNAEAIERGDEPRLSPVYPDGLPDQ